MAGFPPPATKSMGTAANSEPLYWMTGNEKYRTWAFRLADYYFAEHNPVEAEQLRLRDHGCEVISGLAEVYFLAYHR